MYHWQLKGWAHFVYDEALIYTHALQFSELLGETKGLFQTFNKTRQARERMEILSTEAIQTSVIEGEMLSREAVHSSLSSEFWISAMIKIRDKRAENIACLMHAVREDLHAPLSERMLKK